jgi:hypothetical protein
LFSFYLLAAFTTTKVTTNLSSRVHGKRNPLTLISKIYEVPLLIFPSTLGWLIYIKRFDGVQSRRHKEAVRVLLSPAFIPSMDLVCGNLPQCKQTTPAGTKKQAVFIPHGLLKYFAGASQPAAAAKILVLTG